MQPIDPKDEFIGNCQTQLDTEGCSVLKGFLTAEGIARVEQQTTAVAPKAYYKTRHTNCYDSADDPSLPVDHPVRCFMERTQAFVAKDVIPQDDLIAQLYRNHEFQKFVATLLGRDQVFEYADPFGGLVVNVCQPGATHPWHFDTNEFIVSMLTKKPEAGGVFEYCPNIRSPGAENYDAVGKVLSGEDREQVRKLDLEVGDLQLFKGRFALHRVTHVQGDRERLSAIFAYAEQPGMIAKPERAKTLFGKVDAKHLANATTRTDGLSD